VEGPEVNAAVEAGAEGVDDFFFEQGAGAVEKDVAGDEGGDEKNAGNATSPGEDTPGSPTPPVRRRGFTVPGWGQTCHLSMLSTVRLSAGLELERRHGAARRGREFHDIVRGRGGVDGC